MGILKTLTAVPQLGPKLLLTLILIAVYRLGFSIIVPVADQEVLFGAAGQGDDSGLSKVVGLLSLLSASNISMLTIFGLGIMPYISASIVFQLLATVYPPLEALQKEGESGRRRINELTRYATVVICFFQSFFLLRFVVGGAGGSGSFHPSFSSVFFQLQAAIVMTCGSTLLMWIAEQVDEFGLGNGVSLLIMAGILSRVPDVLSGLLEPAIKGGVALGGGSGIDRFVVLLVCFVSVVMCVIFVTQAQRRIPLQSARHSRRGFGNSAAQYLPMRLNQSGVMPVIFASSLMMFPSLLCRQLSALFGTSGFFGYLDSELSNSSGAIYSVLYVFLIFFFSFFWSAITFNPVDVANNLRDYGTFVPGYRPGERTASYLEAVMSRITFVGAFFLSILAVLPSLAVSGLGIDYLTASFFGGTGLLICVTVAIDVAQKIDGFLLAANCPRLLDAGE